MAKARTQPGAATWAKALLRFLIAHFGRLGLNQSQIQRLRNVPFIPASDLRTAPLPPLWLPPQIAKHLLKLATPSGSTGSGSGSSGGKRKGKKGSTGSRAVSSGSKGEVAGGAMALLDEVCSLPTRSGSEAAGVFTGPFAMPLCFLIPLRLSVDRSSRHLSHSWLTAGARCRGGRCF